MAITPTKKELRAEDTKKRILDATENLMAQYGFERVGVKDIADAAGTTTGALYYHFKDKHGILSALAARRNQQFKDVLLNVPNQADPIDVLIDFLADTMTQRVLDDGLLWTQERVLRVLKLQGKLSLDKNVETLVKRAIDGGYISTQFTVEQVADLLLVIYRGTVYCYCISDEEPDLKQLMRQRLEIALSGVRLQPRDNTIEASGCDK